jgi:hypothetical protein
VVVRPANILQRRIFECGQVWRPWLTSDISAWEGAVDPKHFAHYFDRIEIITIEQVLVGNRNQFAWQRKKREKRGFEGK